MIILFEEPERNTLLLGKQYKEKSWYFHNEDNLFNFENETRITFLGHSSKTIYGEMNVNKFVEMLIEKKLQKDRPVTIDLLGCETGYYGSQESFAFKVYQQLVENGYNNIRVNALTDLNNENEIHKITLYQDGFNEMTLMGIPKEIYQNAIKVDKKLQSMKIEINKIKEFASSSSGQNLESKERVKWNKKYKSLKEKVYNYKDLIRKDSI